MNDKQVEIPLLFHTFQFIHQTMAEYFTAKYLEAQIRVQKEHVVKFLNVHYCKPYFRKVRFFLDNFLCTEIPVLRNLAVFKTMNSI